MKRIAIIVAGLMAGGCPVPTNTKYEPATGHTSLSKGDALQRAAIGITDAGLTIESSDSGMGMVISKWFTGEGMFGENSRFRFRVTVSDAGRYQVDALCESHRPGGDWGSCGDDTRPDYVIAKIRAIETSMGGSSASGIHEDTDEEKAAKADRTRKLFAKDAGIESAPAD